MAKPESVAEVNERAIDENCPSLKPVRKGQKRSARSVLFIGPRAGAVATFHLPV